MSCRRDIADPSSEVQRLRLLGVERLLLCGVEAENHIEVRQPLLPLDQVDSWW